MDSSLPRRLPRAQAERVEPERVEPELEEPEPELEERVAVAQAVQVA